MEQETYNQLIEFLSKISNPINDDEKLKKIIQAFSKLTPKDIEVGEEDSFRRNYLATSNNPYLYTKDSDNKAKDFFYKLYFENFMKRFGKRFPDLQDITISSYQDYCNLRGTKRLSFMPSGADYVHINSWINPKRKRMHRLYLNIPSNYHLYGVASLLIEHLENKNIPYYFKIFDDSIMAGKVIDDNFVIYCTSDTLVEITNTLCQLKQEYPPIFSKICAPPVTAGAYNEWIGYGAEPDTQDTSYNLMRTKLLLAAIHKTIREDGKYSSLESEGITDYQKAEIFLSQNEEIIDGVRKNIKQLSKSYGVLSKNFCFNSNQINILIQDLKLDNQEQPR